MNRVVAVGASAVALSVAGGCLHADGPLTRRSAEAELVDRWIEENGLPERARPGAEIFAEVGCLRCHTYLGAGVQNLGAPELSAAGARPRRNERYFARYVRNPRSFGNTVMPRYASLAAAQVEALAVFLESSRGGAE